MYWPPFKEGKAPLAPVTGNNSLAVRQRVLVPCRAPSTALERLGKDRLMHNCFFFLKMFPFTTSLV